MSLCGSRPKATVSNPAPGGPVYCRVELLSHLNTPEPANQGLWITRNVQASVLGQVGAKPGRTLALQELDWTTFPPFKMQFFFQRVNYHVMKKKLFQIFVQLKQTLTKGSVQYVLLNKSTKRSGWSIPQATTYL